ncbi:hypothetical protein HWV62_13325 [Athelia sp. TMB]|nr:hypothetical protein HWV62_13325 [Athelia sp. TMB]
MPAEFCPPLDSSLLAALLADLEYDSDGVALSPSSNAIQSLRTTLRQLAAQATEQVEQELSDELASVHIQQRSTTDSTPEFYYGDTTTSDSGSSQQSFNSPLGFLQAALPDIPSSRLQEALHKAGGGADDVDMESVIEALLTSEYVRELEERGLDDLDDQGIAISPSLSWDTVQPVKKKVAKRKAPRGKTISIVNVRQSQHNPRRANSLPSPDPWTQLTSLASHVASFLPPLEPSYFLSYFHNPDYTTPSAALRAALTDIANSPTSEDPDSDVLFSVLDILRANPLYETLEPGAKHHVATDAQLALGATAGRGEDALDLVWLLNELDDDSVNNLERGVYHATPKSPTSSTWSFSTPTSPSALVISQKPPPGAFPTSPTSPTSATSAKFKSKSKMAASAPQWQSIPVRKPPNSYQHSAFIPARPQNTAWRPQVGGNALGKGGKGDVGELTLRVMERGELLRQAADAWKKGGKKNHGGEVAAYYAERAREVQETLKQDQLDRARARVEAKRISTLTGDTVDLHGTSVAEAVVIVKEILERDGCTPAKPLNIITGRGTHSTNRIGVLKPAVKSALAGEGWHVSAWDGGLIVKGKAGMY